MAFQLYLTSLLKTGQEASVNLAVRRRDSLLAVAADGTNTASDVSQTDSPATSSHPPSDAPSTSSPSPPPSRSQEIASDVLAGRAEPPSPRLDGASALHSSDIANLAAALGKGSGVSGNPIHVTISERKWSLTYMNTCLSPLHPAKGSTIMRLIRFLVLTALGGFCKCISGDEHQVVNLAFYQSSLSSCQSFWRILAYLNLSLGKQSLNHFNRGQYGLAMFMVLTK